MERKKLSLEVRIVICFIVTILYIGYATKPNNNSTPKTTPVLEQVLGGFEIRIVNDDANERLEITNTLGQALAYIERYSMHHDDLIAFDLSTGAKVASSGQGVGVIHTGSFK